MVMRGMTQGNPLSAFLSIILCQTLLNIVQCTLNADEAFITSTSFCICPARSFNGKGIGESPLPGPITSKLQQAFAEEVEYDFVEQYLRNL